MQTQERKQHVIATFRVHEGDTGSARVQIALLTDRINRLNGHLSVFKKDYSSQRGLMKLVGQRRRFLNYLKKHDVAGYQALIQELGLRK